MLNSHAATEEPAPGDGCDICGCRSFATVATTGRFDAALHNVVCQTCGFVYVHPRPTAAALRRYYESEYDGSGLYFSDETSAEELDRASVPAAESRLHFLSKHVPQFKPGAVLEVGCGPGTFIGMLGPSATVRVGVEPVSRMATFAGERYGVQVHLGVLEECDFGSSRFDLVAMFHVLEHVPSPTEALRLCRRLLTPDGVLYIEVPDLFRPNWRRPEDFFQFAHVSTFSAATLERLLRKEGFGPVMIGNRDGFLRAIAKASMVATVDKPITAAPADDWRAVAGMIEQRRRRYRTVGRWLDLADSAYFAARRVGKSVIVKLLGTRRGARIVLWLRRRI